MKNDGPLIIVTLVFLQVILTYFFLLALINATSNK